MKKHKIKELYDVIQERLKPDFAQVYAEIVRMTDTPSDAIVLARIYYYYCPDQSGNDTKLRVKSKNGLCLVKSAWDMAFETGIPEKTISACYKRLENKGFIKTEQHIAFGKKQTHIFLDEDYFCREFIEHYKNMADEYQARYPEKYYQDTIEDDESGDSCTKQVKALSATSPSDSTVSISESDNQEPKRYVLGKNK